ncbi:hypothetical protein INR49_017873 [Caranx melampygus]|nr:hypothetical protein INR49_017873 [Caranx melampygus]
MRRERRGRTERKKEGRVPGDRVQVTDDSNEEWWKICVGKREDGETFLKLSSGKKRGLVPADSIEEI